MMEERKSNKGLVVLIVILIILLLGAGAFIYYGYSKYDSLNSDYNKLSDDYDSANKEFNKFKEEKSDVKQTENGNYISIYNYDAKVYGIGYDFAVYAYNDNMYLSMLKSDEDGNSYFLNMFMEGDLSKSSEYAKVTDVNISESDVNRVFISNNFYTTDAQNFAYFILNDGSVIRVNNTNASETKQNVLKDYKVEKITKVSCNERGQEYCKNLKYELILKDGTTKEIVEK